MKKILFGTLLAGALLLAGCGAGGTDTGSSSSSKAAEDTKIVAAGSTALQPLVDAASESFQEENAGYNISVQGGGSGLGLSQVSSKSVTIGNSDLFAEEKSGVDASKLVDHKVAVVGVAPVVNNDTGVKDLTKDQLKDIFSGKVTNWKDVGGKDVKIEVVNRAEGSGTRFNFEKYALDDIKVAQSQEQDSSGTVRQIVSSTPGAISYLAFSYFDDSLTPLSIDGVEPKEENVQTNDWKIWSYEHMYTNGEPNEGTKKFIDYILSPAIQKEQVKKLGYLSVSDMKVERDAEGKVTKK
ncbi:MAG: phosphate ABC transporter substrate-binding protein PstS family protein [Lactobacillales bacterium]|jgi:phosphate transport system substrate-binding protein|nr:phosphate ABC transporter substrate-binding protein PstS family protein [Lactobacillales bacterium]